MIPISFRPHPLPYFLLAKFRYHEKLKNWIKAIPGSKWIPGTKEWRVPIEMKGPIILAAQKAGKE